MSPTVELYNTVASYKAKSAKLVYCITVKLQYTVLDIFQVTDLHYYPYYSMYCTYIPHVTVYFIFQNV